MLFGALAEGLLSLFTWEVFSMVLLGVLIGTIVGLVPAIGGIPAMAVALPFTYGMDPVPAFALLIAIATVSSNASDITSILFGVPGDAASAALVMDGYPMTRAGQAGRALSANLVASTIGAAFGVLILVLMVPIVRPLVIALASPELLMLTLLGITLVGALSGQAVQKGLLAGLLGLVVAMVGTDPRLGIPRFTFGVLRLYDGVGLVPVALGLFGIPEVYRIAVKGSPIAMEAASKKIAGVAQGIRDVFLNIWLVLRASAIGTGVGILPGLGSAVSQWLAYAHAIQSAKDKTGFGKGRVTGALAPGAANNSGLGGSLLTMVSLGIPGNVTTAVLLGALLIHGISPGRDMLTTSLDLTMSMVWVVVIGNVIMVLALLPLLGVLARVTFVSSALMVPFLVLLILSGAFVARNSMIDVLLCLLTGLVGIAMMAHGWPRPPLILGLVLGGLIERYLFISYSRYGFDFITRPVAGVLAVTLLAVVFLPQLRKVWKRSRARRRTPVAMASVDAPRTQVEEPDGYLGWQPTWKHETAMAGVAMTIGVLVVARSLAWPFEASVMPVFVGSVVILVSLTEVGAKLWRRVQDPTLRTTTASTEEVDGRRAALVAVWLAAVFALVWLFGFLVASVAAGVSYTRFFEGRHWLQAVAVAAGVAACVVLLSDFGNVPFPRGVWRFW